MKLQNSHFVITGANRGIGEAVAQMAAAGGAHLHLVARSWSEKARASFSQKGAASVQFYQADLSTKDGTAKLVDQLRTVEIDLLFNNAGLLTGGLLEQQDLDEIYAMFQVNLNALVHLTHAILPGMLQRKRGMIINNSSVSAFMHFPCASTYAASKAAVVAFTDCLEAELRGTGVSTLCLVTPGIKTRMFDEIEVKYAKNFEIPQDSISTDEYAKKIRAAIESDSKYLWPQGTTAFGLWTARFLNPVFRLAVQKKFRR